MKKLFLITTLVLVVLGFNLANSYAFTAYRTVSSLDHSRAYAWKINNFVLPAGNTITSASVTYYNIYDWRTETDHLYTSLINTPTNSNTWNAYYDADNGFTNYFSGAGVYQIGDWNDPNGGSSGKTTISFNIPAGYYNWLSDGSFGIGIDPDCHYYLSKVQVDINYAPVATPEPASMTLLGLGLLGLLAGKKRKKFSATLKTLSICLIVFCAFATSNAYAYTINDPIGDQIGNRAFDIYGMNISHTLNTITFDIYSNYPTSGYTTGSWATFAGDLAISLDGDNTYEYGVAFTGHNGLTKGGVYAVSNWYKSNNYALAGYSYNKDKIVTIKNGTYKGLADLTWTNISGNNPDYRWSVTLDANDFGIAGMNNFSDMDIKVFYSSATCANDYIKGCYNIPPVATPEPASLTLLGLGLLGLIGLGKRRR